MAGCASRRTTSAAAQQVGSSRDGRGQVLEGFAGRSSQHSHSVQTRPQVSHDEGGGGGGDANGRSCTYCKNMKKKGGKKMRPCAADYIVTLECLFCCQGAAARARVCVGSVTLAVHPSHTEFKWLHSLGPFHTD